MVVQKDSIVNVAICYTAIHVAANAKLSTDFNIFPRFSEKTEKLGFWQQKRRIHKIFCFTI